MILELQSAAPARNVQIDVTCRGGPLKVILLQGKFAEGTGPTKEENLDTNHKQNLEFAPWPEQGHGAPHFYLNIALCIWTRHEGVRAIMWFALLRGTFLLISWLSKVVITCLAFVPFFCFCFFCLFVCLFVDCLFDCSLVCLFVRFACLLTCLLACLFGLFPFQCLFMFPFGFFVSCSA